MIQNFQEKFGSPKEVLIVFGDYDKKDTMQGSEPHISKRLVKLFRRNGYQVLRINEHKTSLLCNKCHCETENFVKVKQKNGKESLLWKLLRCTSDKCRTIHNRDENAVRNMLTIKKSIMAGKGRPKKFIRKNYLTE